jgi:hypothetical protein
VLPRNPTADLYKQNGNSIESRLAFRSSLLQPSEVKMSDVPENALPPTAGRDMEPSSEVDVGECFAPFIPQVAVTPAPRRKPKPAVSVFEKVLGELGYGTTTTDAGPKTGPPVSEAAGNDDDTDLSTTRPNEILTASVQTPLPIPRKATVLEIFTWIKRSVLAQTHLSEDTAELAAFWVISSWFQDALTVLPCLLITGPAYDAMVVLRILGVFCRMSVRVADFRKGDLATLNRGCHTALISEPNLNSRNAALLGNLTNVGFLVVAAGYATDYSMSRAIYAGEHPVPYKIQNSIHFHIPPTNAAPPARPEWLQKTTERVPGHLGQYREKNLDHVRCWTIVPSGLSSERATIAAALGRCIVGAPELQEKIVALLKTHDKRRLFEMSDTIEAVVVEATRALSRDGRKHAYVREIAVEINRLLEARDETMRLNPEKIGHRLKKLGLRTRPLSQSGNGLTFDKATVAGIQQLASVYSMEDMPGENRDLHRPQALENK